MIDITLTRDIERCHAVRHAVFVVEQGIALEEDIDGMDEAATHVLARDGGLAIGTLRILESGPTAKIGRLAVLKSHRGHGIGRALMQAALDHLATRDHLTEVRLGAQIEAVAFYEALGFAAIGDTFLDVGLPHQMMTRPL